MSLISPPEWQQFISLHPEAHILQTEEWGQLKSAFGWYSRCIISETCGALILFKKLPMGYSIGYIPKGPIGSNWNNLWPEVDLLCKKEKAVFLKVEPDSDDDQLESIEFNRDPKFTASRTIQPRRSVLIHLEGNEEEWLEKMRQKTRYNIRLAQKKEISIESSQNMDEFEMLMQTTANRDGFGVHSKAYYQKAYQLFNPLGKCELLVARYQGKPLAGIMVFIQGKRSWYFYGASSDEERNRMPTYLLQWEAMKWAAAKGCLDYDLWGIPDEDEAILEEQFSSRSDGLWGVYRFKRGFGGETIRSVGAWDRVYHPVLYKAYQVLSGRGEI